MRLPLIKHGYTFIKENDVDYITETIEVLEHLVEAKGIKDEEIDVIGEIISNLYGSIEVHKLVQSGKSEKEAANEFMKRVVGSIDK